MPCPLKWYDGLEKSCWETIKEFKGASGTIRKEKEQNEKE
jgi:hypothetical protein